MNNVSEQLERDLSDTARAVTETGRLAAEVAESNENQRRRLDEIESSVREMLGKGLFNASPKLGEELRKILDRLERLHELRNMMELGAFQIQVNRAMENCWRALP